jgi:hypothetical protein
MMPRKESPHDKARSLLAAAAPCISMTAAGMTRRGPGFVIVYRWILHPGSEAAFIAAWSRVSEFLLNHRGSLGSRLHRGTDGIWYSYAQWPSAQARLDAFAAPGDVIAAEAMRKAIAETLPELILESYADFLAPVRVEQRTLEEEWTEFEERVMRILATQSESLANLPVEYVCARLGLGEAEFEPTSFHLVTRGWVCRIGDMLSLTKNGARMAAENGWYSDDGLG